MHDRIQFQLSNGRLLIIDVVMWQDALIVGYEPMEMAFLDRWRLRRLEARLQREWNEMRHTLSDAA